MAESMRIDKFLKISRLIKRRTVAKKACEEGNVFVNDREVKPGNDVTIGDIIRIEYNESTVEVKVLDLKSHVKKEEVSDLIEYL